MEQGQIIAALRRISNEVNGLLDELDPQPETTTISNATPDPVALRPLLWGSRVSANFRAGVLWIEDKIGIDADDLMACMAFETGQTFDPAQRNLAGSSGTGLIQFMASTAKSLGTSTDELAKMTPERQLGFVYKYFRQFGSDFSSWTLEDLYMAILYPKAIGQPNDWVMPWKYGSLAYKQNAGLDLNKDRKITKAEAAAGVRRMWDLGHHYKG